MLETDFYIPLDWDNIGYHQMMNRIEMLKNEDIIQEIDVRASPSLNGYHIYINTFSYVNPTLIFRLRFSWFDDTQKLCMDMQNKKSRYRNVMFSKKVKFWKNTKFVFDEIKMFKYFRYGAKEEWQVINHQPVEYQKKL